MATIRDILIDASHRLTSVSDSPRLDAELLLCDALDMTRSHLLVRLDDAAPENALQDHLTRPLNHEPVAYIVREWEFFSLPIIVRPPTLVPRPETEHLVECALDLLPDGPARVLDIGTGSGCIPIAITANHQDVTFISVDIKIHNLDLAQENAALNKVADRIEFLQSNLFENVGERGPFDIICSNPPYVPDVDWEGLAEDIRLYEDRDALLAGNDGLDIVRRIAVEAPDFLKPNSYLIMEIGHDQADKSAVLLEENGFTDVGFRKDLAGINRVVLGRKPA